jgi:hypothetical protein
MGTVIATRSEMRGRRSPAATARRGRRRFVDRRQRPGIGVHAPRQPHHDAAEQRQSQEDGMPATLIRTCPLCGLRFSNTPLLELHIREDHPRRDRRPERDNDNPADTSDSAGKAADS